MLLWLRIGCIGFIFLKNTSRQKAVDLPANIPAPQFNRGGNERAGLSFQIVAPMQNTTYFNDFQKGRRENGLPICGNIIRMMCPAYLASLPPSTNTDSPYTAQPASALAAPISVLGPSAIREGFRAIMQNVRVNFSFLKLNQDSRGSCHDNMMLQTPQAQERTRTAVYNQTRCIILFNCSSLFFFSFFLIQIVVSKPTKFLLFLITIHPLRLLPRHHHHHRHRRCWLSAIRSTPAVAALQLALASPQSRRRQHHQHPRRRRRLFLLQQQWLVHCLQLTASTSVFLLLL